MGYCIGADGNEHWGIELIDEHSPLLTDEVSEDTALLPKLGKGSCINNLVLIMPRLKMARHFRANPHTKIKDLREATLHGKALSGDRAITAQVTSIPSSPSDVSCVSDLEERESGTDDEGVSRAF